MFVKVRHSLVNLDNVVSVVVNIKVVNFSDNGIFLEYKDDDGRVHKLFKDTNIHVIVDFTFVNSTSDTCKFDISGIYKKCFEKLNEFNEEGDIKSHNIYSKALIAILESEDDMRHKIIKDLNKYKLSGSVGIVDLESTILNYYSSFFYE